LSTVAFKGKKESIQTILLQYIQGLLVVLIIQITYINKERKIFFYLLQIQTTVT